MMKWILAVLAVLGGGGAAAWYFTRGSNGAVQYKTARIERGDIVVTVTATGTVQPVKQVQVGTQVSGVVEKLLADFNSRVKAGQVVAQIDATPFQARADQDRANLARSAADVGRVKAGLVQAEKELGRSRELAKRELISASELDAAVAAFDSLTAQVKVAEAVVDQSRAALAVSDANLRYTTIVSPIDGIVVSRNVDVGQTVAASLQAPTIFVIADDLRNMQLQTSVAEADIGRIVPGQKVAFTVDAYRESPPFEGKVAQVRLASTTVQNVVTYTVMIGVDNPEGKLLPGMTANVSFEVLRREKVLRLPNAALRFTPSSEAARKNGKPPSRVWIQTAEGLKAVPVRTGVSDAGFTEIVKEDLKEGQEVVVGVVQGGGGAPMTNPFLPSRPPGQPRPR